LVPTSSRPEPGAGQRADRSAGIQRHQGPAPLRAPALGNRCV